MSETPFAPCRNGQALALKGVPELGLAQFQEEIIRAVRTGQRLACLCADAELRLFAVLAEDTASRLWIAHASASIQARSVHHPLEPVY